ncbi:GntR family transcriptional regulator [Streptomyces armeniacus]|uniref:GntR family transcriptional regulator n=1 Tax=Streptomyces armeniacus TaxID=83291 RepID=A0A345XNW0_9ACTN|nr:GntR family transcriptional regulator [Streptomyces armeniacus]AXK33326.1 GntR family transcriptional regulator [Streptomyces armeniacus]
METSAPRQLVSVQEHLRDQVAHELRAALLAGELRPGIVYSAPALAAEYGVSATPVREAMLELAREGLVEAVRNKGFRVTEFTDRDLDDVTEIRSLIEIPTVGRVTETATPEQLRALRPAAEETVTAARDGDLVGYLEADQRFHLALLALGGNRHLVRVVGDLRRRSRLYGLGDGDHDGVLAESARQHLELLDVMLDGDAEAAREHMWHHLAHARTRGARES